MPNNTDIIIGIQYKINNGDATIHQDQLIIFVIFNKNSIKKIEYVKANNI